jgi:hypothetical protein
MCAAVCSALTTSMISVAKSVIQTVLGFFTFGGVKFHPLNITGLAMNIMGGIIYTYVKQKEKGRVRRGGSIDEMEAGRKSGKIDFGIRDEDQNNYRTV